MNVQDIALDISKERPDTEIVRIGQGDSSGTTIRATVYDNGQVQSLSGMTATMEMKLPDGKSYASGGSCSISNNVITCIVDEEHFAAVAGYTDEAYFKLVSGTTIYSTSRFRVKVERAASNGADPASSYSDDIVSATAAARQAANDAREAMEEIGTAVEDAAQAAESAAQAVQDAQTAVDDADTAKREATSAANAATAAANNANSKANAANTAANNANTAANTTNSATQRAEAAIAAMGDISEQAVPVMSSDIRGGARIQPDSGLEITDTDNLQVRLALESDGTVRGGIAELTAKGHAEQVSTTGKNLLPNNATSQTVNGVTFTVNEDGSIKAVGTATSDATLYLFEGSQSLIDAQYILTLGTNQTLVTGIKTSEQGWKANFGSGRLSGALQGFWIRVASGTAVNTTIYPMLRLASITDDTYEPYTGAAPSPSPEFPQTIEVVRGRNLLDASESTSTAGHCYANGAYASNVNWCVLYAPCVAGKTYTVSGLKPVSGMQIVNVAQKGAAALSVLATRQSSQVQYTVTPTVTGYIGVSCVIQQPNYEPDTVQLSIGSTPQPYVPYGHVGMDVWSGKNLIRWMYDGVGLNGATGATVEVSGYHTSNYIPVTEGENYTISGLSQLVICWYDSDKSYVSTTRTAVVTAPSNSRYARIASIKDGYPNPMFEKGSQATPYEPYYHSTTPIPLPSRGWVAGLPDGTADALRLDGAGHTEWTLPTKMITLDASADESWSLGTKRVLLDGSVIQDMKPNPSASGSAVDYGLMSDRFRNASNDETINGVQGIHRRANGTRNVWVCRGVDNESLEDFKAWLAANNMQLLYPLATPVVEDCGYCEDWPTDIPEGAVITIPELDAVGVKYFIDSAVTELAKQWYARAYSEYADRITALEQAVAELVTS